MNDEHCTKKELLDRDEWVDHDGNLHRLDGPAIKYNNGMEQWFHHGLLHRHDGPAVIGNEYTAWLQHNEYHRLDGPAIMDTDPNSPHRWVIHDVIYHNNQDYQKAANLTDEDMIILILQYGNIK